MNEDYEIIKHTSPYSIFNKIFANLTFYKVVPANENSLQTYTTYCAKLQSFVGNANRYVILIVRNSDVHTISTQIQHLNWISLQTRTLTHEFISAAGGVYLPIQGFDLKNLDTRYVVERGDTKLQLTLKKRDYEKTEYFSTIPMEIEILHEPKKKSLYQYPDTLELRQALNTFQCVIKKI